MPLPPHSSSRRDFMKRFAVGAGAVAAMKAPAVLARVGERVPPRQKLGIALVGLGYYSTQILGPALQHTQDVELRGIVTGTPAKAERWKAQYGIPEANIYNYETFDRIADNEAIDIIYVVLPNSMHAEYTIRAAEAGKHVICEKPMALNAEECRQMIQACRDAGVQLTIGYRMQFEPHTQEVMRLGQEQVFGPVRMVQAGAGYREGRADHWKLKKAMGGGAMMDMGVYSLQAARYITGEEPIAVTAQTHTTRPELFTEVDETTMFQLEFPGGAVATLYTSFGMNVNDMYTTAADGWFYLRPFSSYSGIHGASSNGPFDFPQINQQAVQMDEQARSIRDGTPMRVPGEEGLRDMIVVDAVYQAIESGERVEIG
ncbi:MAG: gfo/Idh/MocA family oxidoreductase [Bacteroidetes bacterium]|nr:MAG: gfo/Idh/MocA family oxidoreductase [Bacteroidota bacterium]